MGTQFVCAILDSFELKCWGSGGYGTLGSENSLNVGDAPLQMGNNLSVVQFGVENTVVQIHSGYLHSCALLQDGSLKCWGKNDFGQLGQGNTENIGDNQSSMGDYLTQLDLGTNVEIAMCYDQTPTSSPTQQFHLIQHSIQHFPQPSIHRIYPPPLQLSLPHFHQVLR